MLSFQISPYIYSRSQSRIYVVFLSPNCECFLRSLSDVMYKGFFLFSLNFVVAHMFVNMIFSASSTEPHFCGFTTFHYVWEDCPAFYCHIWLISKNKKNIYLWRKYIFFCFSSHHFGKVKCHLTKKKGEESFDLF